MKLTRLRLIGFKSFVESTDFIIEPGLTGVVGPNGCGKSNLVEAVRWVMGEASYKAMRAAEMDDVIFSGNTERPARNHAEVAVQVDNSERNAPSAFNDAETLEVARRIVREQGSSFRINGQEVRARDVAMLFADASTGSRSPALVHQGRIGEIIQARPEQRRRVLEEAAGISGLHARRHEAELRLKAAEQNLARVEDVIGQLAAQVAALRTQARQAARYRNISGHVRRAEALLFHLRWTAGRAELADAEHAQEAAVRIVAARTSAQAQASTRQTDLAAGLPTLREAEAKAAAALQRLVIARETLEREEARARERINELDRRLEQFSADLARERTLAADANAALERLATEETSLRSQAEASVARLGGANERAGTADAALATSEKSFAELTGALADLLARRNQLQAAIREHGERAERLQAELANIEAGLAATASGEADLPALANALAAVQAALAQGESAARTAELAHACAREQVEVARAPLTAAERSVQRLETEAKTIGKLLAVETRNLWPPVMDALTVAKDYEKALGAALGDDLDAPVGDSAPMHWLGAPIEPSDPTLPDGAVALSHFVQGPPELARRLAQIGVVERTDGPRLAKLLKPGQRLVSRDGDLWRWDGFAAAAHAPTGAARRLAERGRLQEIQAELETARAAVEAKRQALADAEKSTAAAAAMELRTRAEWREAQRLTDAAREAHTDAEREISRNAARISALNEAHERIDRSRDERAQACTQAEQALAALPSSADLEAKLAAINEVIAGERSACAELRVEVQAIAREVRTGGSSPGGYRNRARTVERAQRRRHSADRHHRRTARASRNRARGTDGRARKNLPQADNR